MWDDTALIKAYDNAVNTVKVRLGGYNVRSGYTNMQDIQNTGISIPVNMIPLPIHSTEICLGPLCISNIHKKSFVV